MSGNGHCFEWQEEFISQECGNCVVQYFLKDSTSESVCAVIGSQRSVRQMFYVVTEEFVMVYAAENSNHAGFKWRSRREVVDWLTSMIYDRVTETWHAASFAFPDCAMIEISSLKAQALDNMGYLLRNLTEQSSDIL
ncbi:hypothetical protein E1A91_D05G438600v1 [Gossypium mustelinum]|uniref:Uncharacterized protein n=1 Tax=Gossypium mustelinum TaxID=34275 RepID=A0A5D2V8A4_GOSMU|nr:hypothetical protein E1A91_D05G438600v1 [Gossypium mustelinum]